MTVADKNKPRWIFAVAGLAVIGGIGWALALSENKLQSYNTGDQGLVERSYRLNAIENGSDIELLQRMTVAEVIYFPDKRCVQIRPGEGALGGRVVYCFSISDNRVVEKHVVGE